MHKLDRAGVPEPTCLAKYDHRTQTWDDVSSDDKQQIRLGLEQLQDVRCAYCEGIIFSDGHVEHFRRKNPNHFPHLTFAWSNLFLSCGSHDHCGHYKDRPSTAPYNPADLVKPDEHEPDDDFYFHSSGEIRHRTGIGTKNQVRASETIRVFNLNCDVLVAARRRALRLYDKKQPGILEVLMTFEEQDRREFINEEINATQRDPHWTVIRHYFEKVY
jgi:uncharacterized protein (TIGR02646 family)